MMDATEARQRAAVCAEALSWVRTPYHALADKKGAGVDCAMLLVRVYIDTGVIDSSFDPRPYSPQWHMHNEEERYLDYIRRFAREVEKPSASGGSLGVWKFGKAFAHGAIMLDEHRLVHAYITDGQVSLTDRRIEARLVKRPVKFFDFWQEK